MKIITINKQLKALSTIFIGFISLAASPFVYSFDQNDKKNGFVTICDIYTEAINSSMNKEQLSDYIFSNIKNRISDKDALEAHDVIFQLEPAKRYLIFKESAEYSLKKSWNCESVKKLME